jgi:nucleotide-binding universal stress UspA family protein
MPRELPPNRSGCGPVLVALDGSPAAERALSLAIELARAADSWLVLVGADGDTTPIGGTGADDGATVARPAPVDLGASERRARAAGVDAERRVVRGDAADALLDLAAAGAAAFVVPYHGRRRGWWSFRRSAAELLLREAPAPVLFVPAAWSGAPVGDRIGRLLVPLDGSALAEEALGVAVGLARSAPAELILLRVARPPHGPARYSLTYPWAVRTEASDYLERLAQRLRTMGLTARTEAAAGFVDEAIAGLARAHRADAIVMATRARRGIAGLPFGSVALRTVRLATVPVMVVPPGTAHRLRAVACRAPPGRPSAGPTARRAPRTVRPRAVGAAGEAEDAGT